MSAPRGRVERPGPAGPETPASNELPGLSSAQVAARVREGRTNAYRVRTSRSVIAILRANVFTVFNAILATALVLVLLVGRWPDALFGFVMVLNTATGTLAEVRSKRALDRLAVLQAPTACAVRDGRVIEIDVADIVLDDVLRLRSGDQVPADATVVRADGLEVDESILTGESVPVRPRAGERVMSGTTVLAGTALVRAMAVGADAYANRLASEARRYSVVTSELQAGTDRVLQWISWVIVPVALLLFWSQMRGTAISAAAVPAGQWRAALVASIAGVVSMVPQGLVLLTSVNFATASLTLARRRVLVQELPAVEVLARVDTLCLDKTGTLTTGRIALSEVLADDGDGALIDATAALREPLLALTAVADPNATAEAILEGLTEGSATPGADASGPLPGAQDVASRVSGAIAFSSRRKWSAAVLDHQTWIMGAPEIVLAQAQAGPGLLAHAQRLTATGVRVLAVVSAPQPCARGTDDEPCLPATRRAAGLVVLAEQIRSDAARTLAYFRSQGVDVKIISGDNPTTVAAVAAGAAITSPDGGGPVALDARELPAEATDPATLDALAGALEGAQVLGRVTPEQKRSFVRALRSRGRTVAMTGDGVNDSLALKDDDLGIAMGNGAPATRAVARMVLLGGEFSALPAVVAEGRRVMANTERIASLFLSKTVYASLIAVIVAVSAISYPFLPRQLTIVSSLTIGIPAFVLALAPNSRRYRPGFLRRVLTLCVPAGLVAGAATLTAHQWLAHGSADQGQVTTGATLVLVVSGLWLLTLTARPLLGWRLGLIVLMGGTAVLGVLIAPVRSFFLLAWPAPATWLVVAVCGGAAAAGIEAVRLVRAACRPADEGECGRWARGG